MDAQATAQIPRAFEARPDPRNHNVRHKLIDIITIALFAVLCGCDDWCAGADLWAHQIELAQLLAIALIDSSIQIEAAITPKVGTYPLIKLVCAHYLNAAFRRRKIKTRSGYFWTHFWTKCGF